ncbi:hypothetical protein MsAg5_07080 [Methanosarcinaceae archaeon Ag5]|uniref:LemA family protein n=1 Tax=Methanolapillus africanus TaxID=3028297 RepID=A0AAE4MIK6_9EURY|nr:hypothetical protein [Methanosarcinaceae archaeon Ag5]
MDYSGIPIYLILGFIILLAIILLLAAFFMRKMAKKQNELTFYEQDAGNKEYDLDLLLRDQAERLSYLAVLLQKYDADGKLRQTVADAQNEERSVAECYKSIQSAGRIMNDMIAKNPQIIENPMYAELMNEIEINARKIHEFKEKYNTAAAKYNKMIKAPTNADIADKWDFEEKEILGASPEMNQ